MKALSFDDYEKLSSGGLLVPVYREVPGDLLTPVSAFQALCARRSRAFLLESVLGGETLARYSFLGRDPEATLEVRGGRLVEHDAAGTRELSGDLLPALRARLARRAAETPGLPRFTGGAVGFLAYDAVRLFERLPDRHGAGAGLLASFSFYRSLVAFDHVRQRLVLIAVAEPGRRAAYEDALQRLDALEDDLRRSGSRAAAAARGVVPGDGLPADAAALFGDGAGFRASVLRAKEHIAAGDIFQVVLSRQARVPCAADPFTLYRALRMVNPSPYMYFLQDGEQAVAGASPEMLVRVENGRAETRPIAGTRPRGRTPQEDELLARELLRDEKEIAEHVMLVDLGRNDVGRVCRHGSVRVPEFMKIERYSHVAHIVSSVTGDLRPGCDALDALQATLPAGTLSGAPKVRAMQIIDALEPQARGLYGGALGYLDLRGNLDFCIIIRTLLLRGAEATLQAGAGIVADSDPHSEQRETEAKAGAMLEALRIAGRL
jgi:anthranilate synthase component 1